MIFHENCLLADDSHEISTPYFFPKFGKMLQNLPSAAVVFGALRANILPVLLFAAFFSKSTFSKNSFRNTIRVSNSLDPDQSRHSAGPDVSPNLICVSHNRRSISNIV